MVDKEFSEEGTFFRGCLSEKVFKRIRHEKERRKGYLRKVFLRNWEVSEAINYNDLFKISAIKLESPFKNKFV